LNSSKNQLATAGMDPLGESQEGAESLAAQELQVMEVEHDTVAVGMEEVAAVSFKQARSGGVEAALGHDHFGIFQLLVGELQHDDLLSYFHLNYRSPEGDSQLGND